MKKIKQQTDPEYPENVEFWQALQNGVVVFENVCRALVNGYMVRNDMAGRPFKTFKKHQDAYPSLY